MDLRGLANSATSMINPNTPVTVKVSSGYTIGAGGKQIPNYTETSGSAQIQALNSDDLKQLDGLNIQGTIQAIYLRGALAGVIRPDQTGGDLVLIPAGRYMGTWLITKVLEQWPDWCKAVIVLQKRSV